ncbi:MAG: FkbM family methyltransferase [Candidatus Doudnabacteria bacterium]|nr:FkbM family methyltransferase [Candidatus Doudnabacteria bacterium]
MRISYSQNKEDIILQGFFPDIKNGFYVDVGANHPVDLSVTKLFYEKGWRGINVEPNAYLYGKIVADRNRDVNLNIGIADKATMLTLREYPEGDGLSTFQPESQKAYENKTSEYHKFTEKHVDRKVAVRPLKDVLAEYAENKTINFMSIDVEGFEYQVIRGNDWEKFRPQVICIEANHIVQDWRPLLLEAHYKLAFFDGLNNYYVADECSELAENFSYVKAVLIDGPITPKPVADEIESFRLRELALEEKLARRTALNQNLSNEIRRLNTHIAEQERLKMSVKHLIVVIHKIVLLNIEKLNRQAKRPLPKIPQSLSAVLAVTEREKQLHLYDVSVYYDYAPKNRILYKITLNTYMASLRVIYAAAKILYKGLRLIRRVVR